MLNIHNSKLLYESLILSLLSVFVGEVNDKLWHLLGKKWVSWNSPNSETIIEYDRKNSIFYLFIFITGAWGQDTASPFFTSYPLFSIFFFHFHGLEICKTAIIWRFLIASCIYISVDWCNQKTASLYTYQSTNAIRKRHIIAVLHISKSWKWEKKRIKGGRV